MANNAIEESLLSRPDAAEPKGEDSISTLSSRVWVESRKIWRVTFPAMISYVCSFGVLVVTQAFIGHINETQLAAYAIIETVGVRFVNGIINSLEEWYYAVLVLLAGYMMNASVAISVFSICLNISAWEFRIFLGFLSGVRATITKPDQSRATELEGETRPHSFIRLGLKGRVECASLDQVYLHPDMTRG
ncbi:hypothetical protein SAY87_030639 [Trapa incisa]|uniref:Uncharacterized protein n=1 Tax=Trapa incisa TaxID=236973 RepID=A0AAN7KW15_9MYRT|nr:hypothetical protein SAY87_030639 [Trapa incisa]